MSIPVRNNLDMGLNQLLSMLLENLSADPGSGPGGRLIYRTDTNKVEYHNGTGWRVILDSTVTLDQIAAAANDLSLNTHKITNVVDPTNAQDAATKNYVDSVVTGLSPKDSVRAASTANIASLSAPQTIDGISLIAGDRVLVKNQTTQSANGIYVVAAGAWTRATDADTANELEAAAVWVEEGTTQAGTLWTQTTVNFTLGTNNVVWVQFGGVTTSTAGNGLGITGNVLSVNVDGVTIEIVTDTLQIKDLGVSAAKLAAAAVDLAGTKVTGLLPIANGGTNASSAAAARTNLGAVGKFAADITGDGSTTAFAVTHNLGTKDVHVQIFEVTTDALVWVDTVRTSTNVVTVTFAVAPAVSKVYRAVVMA
jgi:hypothetical protein